MNPPSKTKSPRSAGPEAARQSWHWACRWRAGDWRRGRGQTLRELVAARHRGPQRRVRPRPPDRLAPARRRDQWRYAARPALGGHRPGGTAPGGDGCMALWGACDEVNTLLVGTHDTPEQLQLRCVTTATGLPPRVLTDAVAAEEDEWASAIRAALDEILKPATITALTSGALLPRHVAHRKPVELLVVDDPAATTVSRWRPAAVHHHRARPATAAAARAAGRSGPAASPRDPGRPGARAAGRLPGDGLRATRRLPPLRQPGRPPRLVRPASRTRGHLVDPARRLRDQPHGRSEPRPPLPGLRGALAQPRHH